jgi:hypothetical protein
VDDAWFCSHACVEAAAARRLRAARARTPIGPRPRLMLGAILLGAGSIDRAALRAALTSQRQSGLRLAAELQRLGLIDRTTALRALAAQAGGGYLTLVDPAAVRSAPGGLSRAEVRALGIVPLRETDNHTLIVACAAPLPRTALGALETLIGCAVVPYFVSDDDLERLIEAYGAGAADPVDVATAADIDEGAGRIAAVAAAERAVNIAEAHVDPVTWVRIGANGRTRALLVRPAAHIMEDLRWQAATTRH